MSQSSPESNPLSPDDQLPPVEPPSAGFIVQLFLIPGIIVVAIVLVWLLFTWVVSKGDDPSQYIAALERSGPGRWQAAVSLANALRDDRNQAFRNNRDAARQLARMLNAEIDQAGEQDSASEESIKLREYLCRALGEFQVDDGLAVLIRAANTNQGSDDVHVQRRALEAIALLADNVKAGNPEQTLSHPELKTTLQNHSRSDDPLLRIRAAYALGVLGDEEALDRLKEMLADTQPDVRYNAALGLARHGAIEAMPVLEVMLDPEETTALAQEKQEEMRPFKRAVILINALRATRQLAEQNPEANLAPLQRAVEALARADLEGQVTVEAQKTLNLLRRRRQRDLSGTR